MGILWEGSNRVERDLNDVKAAGAKVYFYSGGTTTPIPTYSDASESTVRTNPVVADARGRWPNIFIPFQTSYDAKGTDANGTELFYSRSVPNSDPVEDVADAVAAEELIATGQFHWDPFVATKTGFVRANGQTIGNAASGATERANADTSALYAVIWNGLANAQAAVSTGRGASAAADYAANKTIALPDLRSASPLGTDDMGNSAASLLPIAAIFVNGNATTRGSLLGENTHTMTEAEIRAHTHTFSATTGSDGAHTHTGTTSAGSSHSHTGTTDNHNHTYDKVNTTSPNVQLGATAITTISSISSASSGNSTAAFTSNNESAHTHTFTTSSDGAHTHTVSGTSGSTGSTTAFNTVHRSILGTFFVKL